MQEVIIRNYQGKIPKGTWYCQDCFFEVDDLQLAANHSLICGWVWLYPLNVRGFDEALFEMHASDTFLNSVYLASVQVKKVYSDFKKRRRKDVNSRT